MAEKAILITTSNQDKLASRYNLEKWEYDERLPLGFYLVTDFGNEDIFDVVNPTLFNETFVVGTALENGFVDVGRKT